MDLEVIPRGGWTRMQTSFGRSATLCVLLSMGAAACGHTAPTAPAGALSIATVTPAQPAAQNVPQPLQVQGTGFEAGLVLEVMDPTGLVLDVQSANIQNVLSTSFLAEVVLSVTGTYGLVVRTPDGSASVSFPLTVGTSATSSPTISSISPTSTTASTQAVPVSIAGANFGSSATVDVVDPQGVSTQIGAAGMSDLTSTAIQFSMAFTKSGNYMVTVVSSAGLTSNAVTVFAQ
jgi:hypothetical protein